MKRLTLALTVGGLLLVAFPPSMAFATTGRQLNSTTLPELNLSGVTLADAIDFIRDVSGANVVVNWKALELAGVTRDTQITLRLRSVSLRKALDLILAEAGGGDKLSFSLDQGVIEITTRELADRKSYTRVYPVDDLIMEIPDFTDAPNFSLTSNTGGSGGQGAGGASASGGGSGGLFQGGASGTGKTTASKTKNERAQELIQLIEQVIQPDIWRDNGGTASIRYFNGSLIVTAPRSVHEAIGGVWD